MYVSNGIKDIYQADEHCYISLCHPPGLIYDLLHTYNTHITPDLLYFMTFSIKLQYAVALRCINVISNLAALQRVTADGWILLEKNI